MAYQPLNGHQVFYQWANAIRKTFTYNYLYYETQRDIVNGVTVIRNTGIFIESPGYTSYLVYALLIELIYKKNKNLTRITILVLTMLSSTSTKGFLFLLELTILMYYFSKSGKGEIKQVIKIFGTIFLLIAVIYLAYVILLQKSATSSFLIRQDDLFSALNVWKEHILFGIGYGKTENIINNFTVSRSNNGLSMGLTLLLAQGGLYMFFIYIFAFAAAYKSANRQAERNKILIVGIIALSDMFVSVVVYNTHIIFLITMAYAYAINNNSLARSKL